MSRPLLPADSSPEQIAAQFNVSRESLEKLHAYVELLIRWQQKINLVGPSTTEQIWRRHIADGLQLIDLLPAGAKTVVDLGSGAGIPGLVLAIAFGSTREFEMHLVESNGKKAAFLREAARISHTGVIVHNCRAESGKLGVIAPKADVILARALAPLPKLLDLVENYLTGGAVGLFHKGQDVDTELTEATKYWKLTAQKHASRVEARSYILEIREMRRVVCI